MLTRIEVDGFKSLRNFALDLEPCMAFVGTNSAGKSNILDALALLSRLVSMPVREALKAGRGHIRDQFSLGKDGHTNKMSFAVEMLLPDTTKFRSGDEYKVAFQRARYEIEVVRKISTGNTETMHIVKERLFPINQNQDLWAQANNQTSLRYLDSDPLLENPIWTLLPHGGPDNVSVLFAMSSIGGERLYQHFDGQVPEGNISWFATVLASQLILRNFQFSQVEPSRLRGVSEAADATTLARDGSNLPTVFAALPLEAQARVRANFIRFVPGLRDVEAKKRDDEFYIEVASQDGRRFPARILSDGTLRILALLTLLYSSPEGSLIAIEELENGIYPGQFVALLEALQESTESGLQLLLTSHSPTVISAFKDKPRSLVFVDMVSRDGERVTRARQIQEQPTDRGATSISRQEVELILESTQFGGAL